MTADTQSFSRAAEALNAKQYALSRSVMLLEERLGVKLFERTTRGADLTENRSVVIDLTGQGVPLNGEAIWQLRIRCLHELTGGPTHKVDS